MNIPITKLVKALKKDSGYRETWSANIAMSFKDKYYSYKKETNKAYLNSYDIHIIANKAAENFLDMLCRS